MTTLPYTTQRPYLAKPTTLTDPTTQSPQPSPQQMHLLKSKSTADHDLNNLYPLLINDYQCLQLALVAHAIIKLCEGDN